VTLLLNNLSTILLQKSKSRSNSKNIKKSGFLRFFQVVPTFLENHRKRSLVVPTIVVMASSQSQEALAAIDAELDSLLQKPDSEKNEDSDAQTDSEIEEELKTEKKKKKKAGKKRMRGEDEVKRLEAKYSKTNGAGTEVIINPKYLFFTIIYNDK
jgi:hypothetical protein